jgi:hypothetical protein
MLRQVRKNKNSVVLKGTALFIRMRDLLCRLFFLCFNSLIVDGCSFPETEWNA